MLDHGIRWLKQPHWPMGLFHSGLITVSTPCDNHLYCNLCCCIKELLDMLDSAPFYLLDFCPCFQRKDQRSWFLSAYTNFALFPLSHIPSSEVTHVHDLHSELLSAFVIFEGTFAVAERNCRLAKSTQFRDELPEPKAGGRSLLRQSNQGHGFSCLTFCMVWSFLSAWRSPYTVGTQIFCCRPPTISLCFHNSWLIMMFSM